MTDFIVRALIAGLCIAAIAGPLGSFVVWRRMSYFGDTLAHSALLGIALGILMDINMQIAIVFSSLLFAALLIVLQRRKTLSTDTLLGILAHATLAFGLLILSLSQLVQVNLMGYLFGDLLTIATSDLYWIGASSALVGVLLYLFWNPLLSITVHEDIAQVEGVSVTWLHVLMVMMVALLIAVSMKIVGVLLITSLLIIPPATARRLARSPEQMALGASIIGCLSVCSGLLLSFMADTPAGPSIVASGCVFFLLIYLAPSLSTRRQRHQ